MLFLKNIPVSRKVILRYCLDAANASVMEHPVMQYTCFESLSEQDIQRLVRWIHTQYFSTREAFGSINDTICSMFQQWSPKHFYSLLQMLHLVLNDNDDKSTGKETRGYYWFLIVNPSLPSISIVEYIISRGFQIPDELYHYAIQTNNVSFFKWLDNKMPIFTKEFSWNQYEIQSMVTYYIVMRYKPDLYKYLIEKYGRNAEHLEFLKERLRKYPRLFVDNNMEGFIQLRHELNIM